MTYICVYLSLASALKNLTDENKIRIEQMGLLLILMKVLTSSCDLDNT
jgi:hypothetical protein